MANSDKCCSVGKDDCITRTLGKVGINRSMLITLALVPFAWDGVMWFGHAVQALWTAATTAVGQ